MSDIDAPHPSPPPEPIEYDRHTLRGLKLLELCTPSISYDKQVQSACQAFDPQMYEIIDDTGQVVMIPNIMQINDSNLIDILAWQFHVDFYDRTRDLEFRKRLVQMSIIWHKTKGTVQLVEDVINTYWSGGGARLEEWFDYYDPLPPNYPVVPADTLLFSLTPTNVSVGQSKFNVNAHGLLNDQQIKFETVGGAGGSVLPSPLEADFYYFVVNATANSFQVSEEKGGPNMTLTNGGSGTFQCWLRGTGLSWHDRYRFRVSVDSEVIPPEDEIAVLALIEQYKPVSRWCEGIVRPKVSNCYIGWCGMMLRFIYRTSEKPTNYRPPPP